MLGRALSLAAVTILIGCFAAAPAWAQATNLEAGKSPSQIFAGTCNACHKSPRGLLKSVSAGSLASFLRQHYTTSSEMASLLSAYLVSNGATDTRYGGAQAKGAKEAKPTGPVEQLDRFGRRVRPAAPTQEAARPEPDGPVARPEPGNTKRLARPAEPSDAAKPAPESGQAPAEAAIERGPDGRRLTAKQRLSTPGKPGSGEPPKMDTGKEEPAKSEAAKEDKPASETAKETVKDEGSKPEGVKPAGEGKSETAKIEMPRDTGNGGASPALRPDPVPPVTPAPASPVVPAAASTTPPEPPPAPPAPVTPPTVTASVPAEPPVAPAGPPAPPISQ